MDLGSLMGRRLILAVAALGLVLAPSGYAQANPWNGKVVFQGFWWNAWNNRYPTDWYTYLAKLAPRLREMGFDGIWIPPPVKTDAGTSSMGYFPFDHYDLGDKNQKGSVPTRFGTKDSLLRLVAVAHANGLEVYPDIVLNHVQGGELDRRAPGGSDAEKHKKFRYVGFGGPEAGRWPKDHWNFHPNPDNMSTSGDWNDPMFGPDICYDTPSNPGGNCRYMRDQARQWFVWFKKQTDVDGFRFDAVKHFPPAVVEDLLANAMGRPDGYFAVGEFIGGKDQIDAWSRQTAGRAGTFDIGFRDALLRLVDGGGFFDMGGLPNVQQDERIRTSPFVNSHDTWKGTHWDSEENSDEHNDRSGDWRKNDNEAMPTLDPDNSRADVAYAAAMAVDGSPVVFYEDLFVNNDPNTRYAADPERHPVRPYVVNLVWAHQKLNFKDGAYKVRFQNSPDLLLIERSGRAVIGMNDHGSQWLSARIPTDFGPNVRLHDYSGANQGDISTDGSGHAEIWVPPMGYAVWGPAGITGGFGPAKRRTMQEFQLDDDLGDANPASPGYGGKIRPGTFSLAGAVWAAVGTRISLEVYTEGGRDIELRVSRPDAAGAKSTTEGERTRHGRSSGQDPLRLAFDADREGYHLVSARLTNPAQAPTRAYVKVEYEAPRESGKF